MLTITERIAIPSSEFTFEYARSGGPGGQNVNKVASKVTLRWKPAESANLPAPVRARLLGALANRLTLDGDLLISSQRTRDRTRNMEDCLEKLRLLVLKAATPPKTRRATRPTLASKVRRAESKARRSERKAQRRTPHDD